MSQRVAEIAFEVEHTLTVAGRGDFVFARALEGSDWTLGEGASLGGCPIEPWTDIPRSLAPDGRQRLDLSAFQLRRAGDRAQFTPGQRVPLQTGHASAAERDRAV